MKRLGREAFILFFFALLMTCAFDGAAHGAVSTAADSHDGGSFCAIMHAANALNTPPPQPTFQSYSDETVQPIRNVHAIWSLIHSIDHPPRSLGRPL